MVCVNCGLDNEETSKFCRKCGHPIVPASERPEPEVQEETRTVNEPEPQVQPAPQPQPAPEPQPESQAQPYPYPNTYAPSSPAPAENQYPVATVVGFILGIASVMCCVTVVLGIGCGIAAICLGASERKKGHRDGLSTAALVLGIVGISLSVAVVVLFFVSGLFDAILKAIEDGTFTRKFENSGYGNYSDYFWN